MVILLLKYLLKSIAITTSIFLISAVMAYLVTFEPIEFNPVLWDSFYRGFYIFFALSFTFIYWMNGEIDKKEKEL